MARVDVQAEHGQDLIEYAVLLPFLVLILVGIVQFSVIIFSNNAISVAAREGARYGSVHPSDGAGIIAAARRMTSGLVQDPGVLAITPSLPDSETIQVDVTYDVPLLRGMFSALFGSSQIHARSVMQIE